MMPIADLSIMTTMDGRQKLPTRPFKWTVSRLKAAVWYAEDELTETEIAKRLGLCRQAVMKWRRNPDFWAKVQEFATKITKGVEKYAISKKAKRIAALNFRWAEMHKILADRAVDMEGIPGGATGMMVRRRKQLGAGDQCEKVEEYEFDAALLKEMRECEKQAALELGQIEERGEINVVGRIRHEHWDASADERRGIVANLFASLGLFAPPPNGNGAAYHTRPPLAGPDGSHETGRNGA